MKIERISFQIEAAGCPTACMHCWAQGSPYCHMPVKEVKDILIKAKSFFGKNGFNFSSYPMHEVLNHPEATKLIELINEINEENSFAPMTTNAIALGNRKDWKTILKILKDSGTNTLWLTVHGFGTTHNNFVNDRNAFELLKETLMRANSFDLSCGCNALLTKDSINDFDKFHDFLIDKFNQIIWDIAGYHPHNRLRKYELNRPEFEDILPYRDKIVSSSPSFRKDWWSKEKLKEKTERAYINKALKNNGSKWLYENEGTFDLVCDKKYNIYNGEANTYGNYYGNLKKDGIKEVLNNVQKAINEDKFVKTASPYLYFSVDELPSIKKIAKNFGDSDNNKIYTPTGMYYKWLDSALAKNRKYG